MICIAPIVALAGKLLGGAGAAGGAGGLGGLFKGLSIADKIKSSVGAAQQSTSNLPKS